LSDARTADEGVVLFEGSSRASVHQDDVTVAWAPLLELTC